MKLKIIASMIVISLLSLAIAPAVFAGATFDYGNVPGYPPAGSVNWTAWHNFSLTAGGYPSQVMTEDSTNSSLGTDQGYSLYGGFVRWIMIVSNFNLPPAFPGFSVVTVLLGGLGGYSGSLWSDSFTWTTTSSTDDQLAATPFAGTGVCPSLGFIPISGTQYYLEWYGPPGSYHIYRSQNASGAGNGESNGRYIYLATTSTNMLGNGTYIDNTSLQSWYIVIHATSGGAIDGCHSEPISPTAVTLADFEAQALFPEPAADLQWTTLSEVGVVGFNLYRADEPDGSRQKLNASLLPASHPGQMRGDLYSYQDLSGMPGRTYSYWVEALKSDMEVEELGPQAVTLASRVYLPVLLR